MIQAVLRGISCYYLSIFRISASIRNTLDQLFHNFLWERVDGEGGARLVRWEVVIKPVVLGGLGIDNLGLCNESLLAQVVVAVLHEPRLFVV